SSRRPGAQTCRRSRRTRPGQAQRASNATSRSERKLRAASRRRAKTIGWASEGHRTREYRGMPLARPALETRLRGGAPLILDGATGTELERRGVATFLPLWSARALDSDPELVRQIHADYVACGVDAITANTFRTQRR